MYQQEGREVSQSPAQPQPQQETSIMRFSLQGIPPDVRWPTATIQHLLRALEIGDDGTTLDEVRQQINDRRSMLWVGYIGDTHKMSIVLTIENTALYAWLMGGEDMDDWIDPLVAAMRRYAREKGLTHLKAVTRPGLAKTLKGWRTTATIIRAEI